MIISLRRFLGRWYFRSKSKECYRLAETILLLDVATEEFDPRLKDLLTASRDSLYSAAIIFDGLADDAAKPRTATLDEI